MYIYFRIFINFEIEISLFDIFYLTITSFKPTHITNISTRINLELIKK